MDYEKAYKEALVRAQSLNDKFKDSILGKNIEFIFPELKESEDEKVRKAIIEHFAGSHSSMYPYKGFTKEQIIAWLEEQKPTGWTAEDEEELKIALNTLEEAGQYSSVKWLKNVCLVPQTMQKPWSEEDNKIIEEIINDIECARAINYHAPKEGYEFRENWLKSLKPQLQWKPSDEQMEALDFAADCIVPAEFCFKRKELKGLLEQLKKLKG